MKQESRKSHAKITPLRVKISNRKYCDFSISTSTRFVLSERNEYKMKNKVSLILLTMVIISTICGTCFATNEYDTNANIESGSGNAEYTDEISGDDGEYIYSYEDYENLVGETETGYSQDDLKEYYEMYQKDMKEYYISGYTREKCVRAKVIETAEIEEEYEFNEYYYSVSRYVIQPIRVRILEGDHIGEEYAISYLLTGDSLSNIQYAEVEVGDTIFVAISDDGTEAGVYVDITNTGSNIERIGVVVCIAIIALVLLGIYGGKKGIIIALIILLAFDFCVFLIPNMAFEGHGVISSGISFILLLIATIAIAKLGFNKKAGMAVALSSTITLATLLLTVLSCYLTRTVGITFEVAAISENIILGNINFEHLYIISTLIIAAVAVTNIICKFIAKIDEDGTNDVNEKLEIGKEVLNGNILNVVIALFVMYIPNQLLLLTNKYTAEEIWNSEMLVSELIRIFAIIMALAISIPATAFAINTEEEKKK